MRQYYPVCRSLAQPRQQWFSIFIAAFLETTMVGKQTGILFLMMTRFRSYPNHPRNYKKHVTNSFENYTAESDHNTKNQGFRSPPQ